MFKIIWKFGKWQLENGHSCVPSVGDLIDITASDKDYVNGFAGCYPVETTHIRGYVQITGLKMNRTLGYSPLSECAKLS